MSSATEFPGHAPLVIDQHLTSHHRLLAAALRDQASLSEVPRLVAQVVVECFDADVVALRPHDASRSAVVAHGAACVDRRLLLLATTDCAPVRGCSASETVAEFVPTDIVRGVHLEPTPAGELGVGSWVVVPLMTGHGNIASLHVIASTERSLTANGRAVAMALAATAAIAIECQLAIDRVSDRARRLEDAVQHREVIERAKGLVMAGADVDAEQAFDRIRRYARRRNQQVRAISQQLVTGSLSWRHVS